MSRKRTEQEIAARLRELLTQQENLQEQLTGLTGHLSAEVSALGDPRAPGAAHQAPCHVDLDQVLDLLGRMAVAPTEADAVDVVVSAARHLLPGTRGALSLEGEDGSLNVVGVWDPVEQWNRPYRDRQTAASSPQRLAGRVSAGPTGPAATFAIRGFGLRIGELRVWPESDQTAPEWVEPDGRGELIARSAGLVLGGMALQGRLRRHTVRDPLTGLFNRRYLEDTLQRDVARAARENGPVGLMILDIDRFSLFNDSYGHEEGDRMLRAIAELIRTRFRGSDIGCRYSGERFAIALLGSGLEDTRKRGEALRQEIEGLVIGSEPRLAPRGVTVSVGVAVFPKHAASADGLLAVATHAIFLARQDGGNSVRIGS